MRIFLIVIALLNSTFFYAQNNENPQLVQQSEFIKLNLSNFDLYLNEVYQEEISYVHLNDSRHYNRLLSLMENRMFITYFPYHDTEKYDNLLNMPLFNIYNSNLVYDYEFDINSFNPFKYDLDFFPRLTKFYRIAYTDYALIINPN